MTKDPDFEIVRRCQSADEGVWEGAFEELFERYKDRVYNTALRIVGNPDDAMDVTQEAFVTVFRSIGQFRFGARFFTWVYRIVVNLAIDRKKKERARPPAFSQGVTEIGPIPDLAVEDQAIDRHVEAEHAATRVHRALERLSPKLRAILVLRYLEGFAYAEIGSILGCSLGTVKSRLSRAHRALQEVLEPRLRSEEPRSDGLRRGRETGE